MAKIVVVINHWGGVPRAIQENLTSMQTWKNELYNTISLSTTNGTNEYLASTRVIWRILKENGFHTVVFGASGYTENTVAKRHTTEELQDPRFQHSESHHVDRTSLYDGAFFKGPSFLHDTLVLEEASQYINNYNGQKPVVLWINLLSCHDIILTRFRNEDACEQECCTAIATSNFDNRLLPQSLEMSLPQISKRFAECNARRFGETGGIVRPGEYITLLNKSLHAIDSLQVQITEFVAHVLAHGGNVAMTATRSLLLGEYSCRDDNTPLNSCAKSFWCSTFEQMSDCKTVTLIDLIHRFISIQCNVTLDFSFTYRPTVCTTSNDDELYSRVECVVNDHHYVCIGKGEELLYIFDSAEDPQELKDIRQSLSHIYPTILSTYLSSTRALLPPHVVHLSRIRKIAPPILEKLPSPPKQPIRRPPALVLPSTPSPPSQSQSEDVSDVVSMQSGIAPSERERQRNRRQASALRAKETRLNKMHR